MTSQINRVTLDLPIKIDVEEVRLMVFLSLYGKGTLSSGKAASYVDMSRMSFLDEALSYGITTYSDDESSLEDALDIQL